MEDKKRKKDEKRKREASQKVSVFVLPDSMSSRTDILKFNVCILTQYAGSKICAHSPISFKMAVLHGYMYGSIKVTSVRSLISGGHI